jgi:PAS domain S-box-containing protein
MTAQPEFGNLLVVDDDENNRDMLCRRLKRAGYEVSEADGGVSALEKVEHNSYDLILLDIMMPDVDGIEVLKRLRKTYSLAQLPIIMATAKGESSDIVDALQHGANDYVTKPIDFPVVLARVKTQLARKQAEDELARANRKMDLILQAAPDGIYGIGADGATTFVNLATSMLAERRQNELLGADLHQLLHAGFEDGTPCSDPCPVHASLRDAKIHRGEMLFRRKDASTFPVEYVSAPLLERDEVVGSVVVFKDITERRAVDKLKDEFISVVRRRIHAPLSAVRGSLGLLASGMLGELPGAAAEVLQRAVGNTDSLVRVLSGVLDLVALESGSAPMEPGYCDSAELVITAVDAMRTTAEKAGVTLAAKPQSVMMHADGHRITQVLTNLIQNAIQVSSSGSTVTIGAQPHPIGGDAVEDVVFTVTDQGPGIPERDRESLFQRFHRVSNGRDSGGVGVGLAISRNIVSQHGGSIGFDCTDDGTTFRFSIPTAVANLPRSEKVGVSL